MHYVPLRQRRFHLLRHCHLSGNVNSVNGITGGGPKTITVTWRCWCGDVYVVHRANGRCWMMDGALRPHKINFAVSFAFSGGWNNGPHVALYLNEGLRVSATTGLEVTKIYSRTWTAYGISKVLTVMDVEKYIAEKIPHYSVANISIGTVFVRNELAEGTRDLLNGSNLLALAPVLGLSFSPTHSVYIHLNDAYLAHIRPPRIDIAPGTTCNPILPYNMWLRTLTVFAGMILWMSGGSPSLRRSMLGIPLGGSVSTQGFGRLSGG